MRKLPWTNRATYTLVICLTLILPAPGWGEESREKAYQLTPPAEIKVAKESDFRDRVNFSYGEVKRVETSKENPQSAAKRTKPTGGRSCH